MNYIDNFLLLLLFSTQTFYHLVWTC